MQTCAGRMAMVAGKRPYDAELEYLEATGTQYVDTGVAASSNLVVKARARTVESPSDKYLLGAYSNSGGTVYRYSVSMVSSTGGPGYYFLISTSTANLLIRPSNIYAFSDIEVSISKVAVDGVSESISRSAFSTNVPVYLFCRCFNTAPSGYSKSMLGNVQMYTSGTLVRDLIPVRFTNENGVSEGAMYDRVTRELFRNAGTGDFIIGPDKT